MIPFNKPYLTGAELAYITAAHTRGELAGDGEFTRFCQRWLEHNLGCARAFLTPSCTAALEMCALMLDIRPQDEVILPSFTFPSTANAFVLRGAVPVFVDIRADTLNLDAQRIEAAITAKTKAIAVVHYAGVGCDMAPILDIAARYRLKVIEDAAQAIGATYRGQPLGTLGDLGALSFHATKNVIAGEGGALLVNDDSLSEQAEIIREKGTDRSRFRRGQVDKYTWRAVGSSFLPGELTAACLRAQLEHATEIQARRMAAWNRYREHLQPLADRGRISLPTIPDDCGHNAHIFYVLLHAGLDRQRVLARMRKNHCEALFHYVPLHTSPAGKQFGRTHGALHNTERIAQQLIRLPLWVGITEEQQQQVVRQLDRAMQADGG